MQSSEVGASLADLVSAAELRTSANMFAKMDQTKIHEYAKKFMRKWDDVFVEAGFHHGTEAYEIAVFTLSVVNFSIFDKQ